MSEKILLTNTNHYILEYISLNPYNPETHVNTKIKQTYNLLIAIVKAHSKRFIVYHYFNKLQ